MLNPNFFRENEKGRGKVFHIIVYNLRKQCGTFKTVLEADIIKSMNVDASKNPFIIKISFCSEQEENGDTEGINERIQI